MTTYGDLITSSPAGYGDLITSDETSGYGDLINIDNPILPVKTQVTQNFGTYNPVEPTQGNLAGDTNFATDYNVPVSLPHGKWHILKANNSSNPQGAPYDYSNEGYGNDIVAQNTKTGEKLHFLHLSSATVKPGELIDGNSIVGTTGSSGNATGPNLGVEYYDKDGNIGDVLSSPYAKYFNL